MTPEELREKLAEPLRYNHFTDEEGAGCPISMYGGPIEDCNCAIKDAVDEITQLIVQRDQQRLSAVLKAGPKHIDPGVYTVQPITGRPNKLMTTGFNNACTQWRTALTAALGPDNSSVEEKIT